MKLRLDPNKLYMLLFYSALSCAAVLIIPGDGADSGGLAVLAGLLVFIVFSYEGLLRSIEQVTGKLGQHDELAFFSAFIELNKKIHTFLRTDDVLLLVNEALKQNIRARKTVFLLNPELSQRDAAGGPEDGVERDCPLQSWPSRDRQYNFMQADFCEAIQRHGKVVSRLDADPAICRAFAETDTGLAVPIIQDRRILCVILIGHIDRKRHYSDFELEMFNFLANQLSIVLDRIRVYEQIMQKTTLDHQEKVHVMQSLSANIAHEMRTPLSGIRASISGIETYLPDLIRAYDHVRQSEPADFPAIREGHLSTLKVTPGRITLMIDQANAVIDMLLMNLRENALDEKLLRLCSAADSVEQAVDRYPFKTGEREKVILQLSEDFHYLGIETLFIYVMFNLLKNALYSIRSAQKGDIRITLRRGEDCNYLLFRDSGLGIEQGIRERIFEGFFTTKADGTGAGLAYCRRTVVSFGGSIECDSRPGEYAEFSIALPHPPAAGTRAQEEHSAV